MNKQHLYHSRLVWTGNRGIGTSGYRNYDRSHQLIFLNKPVMEASSDPAFLGDPTRYNPEELLLAALSSCHMLWYLHLCSDNGIIVTAYEDEAVATMEENDQGGKFTEVVLHPRVTLEDSLQTDRANALHSEANAKCFIANSCNFPVRHEPACTTQ